MSPTKHTVSVSPAEIEYRCLVCGYRATMAEMSAHRVSHKWKVATA